MLGVNLKEHKTNMKKGERVGLVITVNLWIWVVRGKLKKETGTSHGGPWMSV